MRKLIPIFLILLILMGCGESEQREEIPVTNQQSPVIEETPTEIPAEEKPQVKEQEEKAPIKVTTADDKPKEEKNATTEDVALVQDEEKNLCTISVTCEKLVSKTEKLDEETAKLVPQNGYVLATCTVEFTEGESVFDVLKSRLEKEGVAIEYREDVVYKSVYVVSIGGISEKDCGAYSGWMYKVNGIPPTVASSEYIIKDGDVIEFYYSC